MIFATKKYKGFPFAHRVHSHEGHCSMIHGHSWDIEIQFSAERLDKNGFVLDLGKLKQVKEWLDDQFDHTLVLRKDDPMAQRIVELNIAQVILVDSCSSEGLAQFILENVNAIVLNLGTTAHVVSVTVREDEKNSATYIAP